MPLFCWFDHFLDSRTEICQIFLCCFWKISEINWPLKIKTGDAKSLNTVNTSNVGVAGIIDYFITTPMTTVALIIVPKLSIEKTFLSIITVLIFQLRVLILLIDDTFLYISRHKINDLCSKIILNSAFYLHLTLILCRASEHFISPKL